MINLSLLRGQESLYFVKSILKKDPSFPVERLIFFDEQVRAKRSLLESLQRQKNDCVQRSKSLLTEELKEQSLRLTEEIKQTAIELETLSKDLYELHMKAPNIPDQKVPEGGKESNFVVKEWGIKPLFSFDPKNHLDLGNALGWFDLPAAAKMTCANFILYKKDAVRLIYALGMFMLKNNSKYGFDPVLPPVLINEESLVVSGNFPKFRDQVFSVTADNLFLSPTSEVNIANIYRDHIFNLKDLPVRMTAFTSCFRREAGSYGSSERGLIRIHQFEKVELYSICEPEKSMQELDLMIACAENILQALGLHYRVSLLAAQDCSFQSAKTYDIEVWLPGQKSYIEVSSASNCTDFQARRGMIRYRKVDGAKPELVHTLNASSLALPRLMVALIETYQNADGSITLPSILGCQDIF